ncbi:unnamed protein product, partial [Effrenium voratum]
RARGVNARQREDVLERRPLLAAKPPARAEGPATTLPALTGRRQGGHSNIVACEGGCPLERGRRASRSNPGADGLQQGVLLGMGLSAALQNSDAALGCRQEGVAKPLGRCRCLVGVGFCK